MGSLQSGWLIVGFAATFRSIAIWHTAELASIARCDCRSFSSRSIFASANSHIRCILDSDFSEYALTSWPTRKPCETCFATKHSMN